MSNVCEAAWGHVNVDADVPPLIAETATGGDWTSAFQSRSELLDLIVSNPRPRYLQYHGSALKWQQVVALVQKAREQARAQRERKFNPQGLPHEEYFKKKFCNTLTAAAHAHPPFCQVRE